MGNLCSAERKGDKDEIKRSPKTQGKASKYAVQQSGDQSENDEPARGSDGRGAAAKNGEGFSVMTAPSSASTEQTKKSDGKQEESIVTGAATTKEVFYPNPVLEKDMSYKIVPPCEQAVIKQNSRDPADYEAEGLEGAVWTRVPGQINDQRINIANCKNSTFILLDQCDSVQIDDCDNCQFYIGPTAGSVFIRSSRNCKMIAACGQLRTRDLHDSTLALFCHSRPVIESSKNIGVACYPSTHGYKQLLHHMCKSRLSQFTNLWFFIHDFTPSKKAGELNYHIVPQSVVESPDFFPKISELMPEVLTVEEADILSRTSAVIPYISWNTTAPSSSLGLASLVIFNPGAVDAARAFVATVELERRTGGEGSTAFWHTLVEHQSKGPLDASTASALQQLGVPASDISRLNGRAFIMGVYSHAEENGLASELPQDVTVNVLFHGRIEPAHVQGVCLRVFSDLPTQGKGFGSSH